MTKMAKISKKIRNLAIHTGKKQHCVPTNSSHTCKIIKSDTWYSLEQYIGLKEDKLSSTTVDFIRSEGNLETKRLYWFSKPKMC